MVSTPSTPAVVDPLDRNYYYISVVTKFITILGWHQFHTVSDNFPRAEDRTSASYEFITLRLKPCGYET